MEDYGLKSRVKGTNSDWEFVDLPDSLPRISLIKVPVHHDISTSPAKGRPSYRQKETLPVTQKENDEVTMAEGDTETGVFNGLAEKGLTPVMTRNLRKKLVK